LFALNKKNAAMSQQQQQQKQHHSLELKVSELSKQELYHLQSVIEQEINRRVRFSVWYWEHGGYRANIVKLEHDAEDHGDWAAAIESLIVDERRDYIFDTNMSERSIELLEASYDRGFNWEWELCISELVENFPEATAGDEDEKKKVLIEEYKILVE
jgi:hypothetical protein